MPKQVLLVGHCGIDGPRIAQMVQSLDAQVSCRSAGDTDELRESLGAPVDLVLLNREIPYGFDEKSGVELIRKLKEEYPDARMMLVSDLPDAQRQAIDAGAMPGFGKSELASPRVAQLLRSALHS